MTTVHIALTEPSTQPVPKSIPKDAETVTTSGTDTDVAGIAGQIGDIWVLTCTGGNVYVAFGDNPTAGVDQLGYLMLDGETREFAVTIANEECSVKDA